LGPERPAPISGRGVEAHSGRTAFATRKIAEDSCIEQRCRADCGASSAVRRGVAPTRG
jgi:hypothetical protein